MYGAKIAVATEDQATIRDLNSYSCESIMVWEGQSILQQLTQHNIGTLIRVSMDVETPGNNR